MNNQTAEKRIANLSLQVHSVFHTIQGEGPFTGRPAVFIRLAGCNLTCPSCDTDYTSKRSFYTAKDLFPEVEKLASPDKAIVVITGGEPFRQNIEPIVALLLFKGYTVQIETNGTLPPPGLNFKALCSTDLTQKNMCFVVCSPKTGRVNSEVLPLICAYKYVMAHDSVNTDGLPLQALEHPAHPFVKRPPESFPGPIYLQPCDDKDKVTNDANLEACVASCLNNGYTLQLQVHKIIEME